MNATQAPRAVLVAGASGGIGGASARVFAAESAAVSQSLLLALHGGRGGPALEALAAEFGGPMVQARAFAADLTDPAACDRLIAETVGWAGDGIRANAVCAGMIRMPLTEPVYQDGATLARREELTPLGRIDAPRDVAEAVVFLSGPRASYVTGVSLLVDGGVSDGMLHLIPGRPDKPSTPA